MRNPLTLALVAPAAGCANGSDATWSALQMFALGGLVAVVLCAMVLAGLLLHAGAITAGGPPDA